MMLKIVGLNKSYGKNHALDNFNYEFKEGIYGLLGPNGAGKSTLMNIITDNLSADTGEITLDGDDAKRLGKEYRKILGYMPQQQGLYSNFTLLRFLYYMAALKGIPKSHANEQIEQLISLVNLNEHRLKRLGSFSGGMKQRALIAQAMLGNPKILILDEPTAGLDPKERIRIRNLIAEIAFDKIVIIATHVVSDIQFIAKEVLLLKKGRIVSSDSPHKLCKRIDDMVFEINTSQDELETISRKYRVASISKDEESIFVRVISQYPPESYEYKVVTPNLEDLYLHVFDEELVP